MFRNIRIQTIFWKGERNLPSTPTTCCIISHNMEKVWPPTGKMAANSVYQVINVPLRTKVLVTIIANAGLSLEQKKLFWIYGKYERLARVHTCSYEICKKCFSSITSNNRWNRRWHQYFIRCNNRNRGINCPCVWKTFDELKKNRMQIIH